MVSKQQLIENTRIRINETMVTLDQKYKDIEQLSVEYPDHPDISLLERVEASTLEVKLHTLNSVLKRLILKPQIKDNE